MICDTLKNEPQFSIVGGPVDSGKSTLMSEVLRRMESKRVRPAVLKMDLRSLTFRDVESFSSSIAHRLEGWHMYF